MEVKLLIVEDETILREGLYKVGNWEENGIEICGLAANGKEALEMILKCKPDIVLTDVVMPVMDGIELTRKISELYPDIKIVMLSGHEEFQYAQKAIEYRVKEYLLKPAKIEVIQEALLKIKEEIQAEQDKICEESKLREELERSKPILREQYLNKIISGKTTADEDILGQFDYYDININTDNLVVLLFQCDSRDKSSKEMELINIKIKELCKEVLQYPCVMFSDLKDRIVVILNYDKTIKNSDNILYLTGKGRRIQSEMERKWGLTISVGVSRLLNNIGHVQKAYIEAENALSYKFFMGDNSVIYIGDLENDNNGDQCLLTQIEQELITCISTGDTGDTRIKSEELFAELKELYDGKPQNIYDELIMYISILIRSMKAKNMDEITYEPLESYLDGLRKNKISTLLAMQEEVTNILVDISEYINRNRLIRSEGIVEKAKKYVEENLSKDVSLITVADYVYVSPNYLSFLFKEKGENFKE